jgi:sugar/nucleoside kinase (ribokinase family)
MNFDVAGIGNALMDALVIVENDALLTELGLTRGMMHPVDHDRWMHVYDKLRDHSVTFDSGGSCANTLSTVGLLGGRAILYGQVGDDQMGRMYAHKVEDACGTHALHFVPESATGKCLSIISKSDAERTMLTDLGAATGLSRLGAFADTLTKTRWVHVEGYALLGPPMCDTVLEGIHTAKAAGALVSLDASDPFVVHAAKDRLWGTIRDYTDLVFLNAEEARLLTGEEPEVAIHRVAAEGNVRTVVVKLGGRGSLVLQGGQLYRIPVRKVQAVDTTGAGDAYAGGFLFGTIKGWSAEESGHLASAVAALTVGQIGAVVKDRSALARLLAEHRSPSAAGA